MVNPVRAAVRPRVVCPQYREPVLLEEFVRELACGGQTEMLALYGPPGAGTTSALQHLQAVIGPDTGIELIPSQLPTLRDPNWPTARIRFPVNLTMTTTVRCSLAGWQRDEWIEYLLAVHHDACGSVIHRLPEDPASEQLDGNPSLWSQILDLMALDPALDLKLAFAKVVDRWLPDSQLRSEIAERVLLAVTSQANEDQFDQIAADFQLPPEVVRLMFIVATRRLLATEAAWRRLQKSSRRDFNLLVINRKWPRTLIEDLGTRIAQSPPMQVKLRRLLSPRAKAAYPLVASLLHSAGANWIQRDTGLFTNGNRSLSLRGAFLDGVDFTAVKLRNCNLTEGSFENARFSDAILDRIEADRASFHGVCFHHAVFRSVFASNANFLATDLSGAQGETLSLIQCDLTFANLTDVKLIRCTFAGANLSGAIFHRALLKDCCLRGACLDDADFMDANLESSDLTGLALNSAAWNGASFRNSRLDDCDLSEMKLDRANFDAADLTNADLTCSTFRESCFERANLRGARLAEVDWELANLRDADLSGATFHMGSTRSGLVGVSIPLYGSRTGFYTDELLEQDFKAPEEIRKANLRGADLRGAKIDNVDFYLVDLRDALFDPEHESQLRRTGAILSCN
jgi:uncharacterized protein YjbI with pentapeptide repeats